VSAESNIATIKSIYAAFGRGDAQTILDAVSDDVDWATETTSTAAPWYGPHRGKEQVNAFFAQYGGSMETDEFTPVSIAATDSEVLTVVRLRARVRATGHAVAMDLHHRFTFRDGAVVHYRGTEDTAQMAAAFGA
jgi:ketosteroid isomerase-like protein